MRPGLVMLVLGLIACDERGTLPAGDDADATTTTAPDGATTTSSPDGSTATSPPDGDNGDGTTVVDPDVDYTIPETPAPAVRRLSGRELANTYTAVVGVAPTSLAGVPPDPRDETFDRIVNAQTVSPIHAEAYDAAAREAADWLIAERRLDDFAPACTDAIMPPGQAPTTSLVTGIGLVAYPDWALLPGDGNPDRLLIRYAPECGVSVTSAAPVDGTYRVKLDSEVVDTFDVALSVDGETVHTFNTSGAEVLTFDLVLTAGTHLIAFDYDYTGPQNPYVWVQSLTLEGPIDVAGDSAAAARASCVTGLIDALATRAFRRPITDAEHTRLAALHDGALEDGSWGDATRMLIRAVLGSPKFLYLVETGTPVDGAVGRYTLDDWQIASRLSYAICEGPPDQTLRDLAAAGNLHDGPAIRTQAERLMALPCAHDTLARFYRQWLWLERLPSTAKDPAVFPDFTSATALAMAEDADDYLKDITFDSAGNVADLYLTPRPVAADPEGVDRHGLLMLPGVLTVTSKFTQTSPVIRGKFVLEQLLCDELPSPPVTVDTTPPELDPTLTSRERWAAHSEAPSCKPCHERIDPIGFTFEEFDAMGTFRAEENGLPINAKGSAPVLGITDESLDGVDDLAAAIASSERASTCLARQWLRFAIGRLEEEPDSLSVAEVSAALAGPSGSLKAGFIALTGTSAFRERVERQETEDGQ